MMPGMIMLWYGTIATIPSGWALCDGTQNTPDLGRRFVYGLKAGDVQGQIGGGLTHQHAFTGDGHAHDLVAGAYVEGGPGSTPYSHETSVIPAAGTTNNGTHTPPYMILAYIMKLPIP